MTYARSLHPSRWHHVAALTALLIGVTFGHAEAARQYIAVPLGPGSASAINASGRVVVGTTIYTPGQPPVDLASLGVRQIAAINSDGSVAGFNTGGQAFVLSHGALTTLSPGINYITSVTGLDDTDVVWGNGQSPPLPFPFPMAFRYAGGSVRYLSTYTYANGVSASGWMTGSISLGGGGGGSMHAMRYINESITDIHPPFAATVSSGKAVNDFGDVSGAYGSGLDAGLLLVGSSYIDFGRCRVGFGINNAAEVVGHGSDFVCPGPFVYTNGLVHDLNQLIAFGPARIQKAPAINNAGQIAASGIIGPADPGSAFRLDPIERYVDRGDFDGDMRTDLLWRNTLTGTTATWLMNGTSSTAA